VPAWTATVTAASTWYCQLNATLGLFSLKSGEERAFLESFFAKNYQETTKKPSQWGKRYSPTKDIVGEFP
jgi:hypothetical protein